MNWSVFIYTSPSGRNPIDEFIQNQQQSTKAKITHLLRLLERHGPNIRMPYSKKIDSNLFELRVRGNEIRILYCNYRQGMLVLNIFKKKANKIPKKEIETARKRYSVYT